MSKLGQLPVSIEVGGVDYEIRTDRKAVFDIISAFSDPELKDTPEAIQYVCLFILYPDFDSIPDSDLNEAYEKAIEFINGGTKPDPDKKPEPEILNWAQDEPLLFAALNDVAGFETRSVDYIHWWTVLGWLMNLKDGIYKDVLTLRSKKARGEKLEKAEQKFWNNNIDICKIKEQLSEKEKAAKQRLEKLLD